jgi:tmRNA-binding protein
LINNLIIKESTDPLSENLKTQMLSTDEKKLKSLALTNEELSKIIQNLNDNSKDLITIQLYHRTFKYICRTGKKFDFKFK